MNLGSEAIHLDALLNQRFRLRVRLERVPPLDNEVPLSVLRASAARAEPHAGDIPRMCAYDRLLPLPRARDQIESYMVAEVALASALGGTLRECRQRVSPHKTQLCLVQRGFWPRVAVQFPNKPFAIELAQWLVKKGAMRDCRNAAFLVGEAAARDGVPASIALASCAANVCENYCLRGAVAQLTVRAFDTVAVGRSVSDKAKMKPVQLLLLRTCAALRLDVLDGAKQLLLAQYQHHIIYNL